MNQYYKWFEVDPKAWIYSTPMLHARLIKEEATYQFRIFDGRGCVVYTKFKIASKQNAMRQCVAWITQREEDTK
jgi:hypothetical protein